MLAAHVQSPATRAPRDSGREGALAGQHVRGEIEAVSIFIIHPSKDEGRHLASTLATEATDTATFESAEEFLRQVGSDSDGCVVLTSNLPGMGTLRCIEAVRERRPALRIVVLGHNADVTMAVEMVRAGATEYVEPPALPRRLRSAVRHAIGACKP